MIRFPRSLFGYVFLVAAIVPASRLVYLVLQAQSFPAAALGAKMLASGLLFLGLVALSLGAEMWHAKMASTFPE